MSFDNLMAEINDISQLSSQITDKINETTGQLRQSHQSAYMHQSNLHGSAHEAKLLEQQHPQQMDGNVSLVTSSAQEMLSQSNAYLAIIQAQDQQITQLTEKLSTAKEEAKAELKQEYNLQLKQKLAQQLKQDLLQDIPSDIKKLVLQQTSDEEIEILAHEVLEKHKRLYKQQMDTQLQQKYLEIERIRSQAEDKSKLRQQEIEFKKKIDSLNRQIEQNNSKNLIKLQKQQQRYDKLQEELDRKQKEIDDLRQQLAQFSNKFTELNEKVTKQNEQQGQLQALQSELDAQKQYNEQLLNQLQTQQNLLNQYRDNVVQFSNDIKGSVNKSKSVKFQDQVEDRERQSQVQQSAPRNTVIQVPQRQNNNEFLQQMKEKYLHSGNGAHAQAPQQNTGFQSDLLRQLQNSQSQIEVSSHIINNMIKTGDHNIQDGAYVQQQDEKEMHVISLLNKQNEQQQVYFDTINKFSFINSNKKLFDLVTRAFQFLNKIWAENEIDFRYRNEFIATRIDPHQLKLSLESIRDELNQQNAFKQKYGTVMNLIRMREELKEQDKDDLDLIQQIINHIKRDGEIQYRGINYLDILQVEGVKN